jgi:ABC-type Na+ efflux pump permease subunit
MSFNWTRVRAITIKELRDYRHNRFVIGTMAFLPVLFIALPMVQLLTASAYEASSRLTDRVGLSLLYLLVIPAFIPSTLAAYSVVGEREQGTLEPILITPISREEFLVGKALAVAGPTLAIAYVIFGIFLAVAKLFAEPIVSAAVFAGSHILVQLLFTPLLAGWSIWVGIAISARSTDIRVAQQLSVLASLPPLAVIALMQFKVISASIGIALALAALLLTIDALGWRAVAAIFDRERLITGRKT